MFLGYRVIFVTMVIGFSRQGRVTGWDPAWGFGHGLLAAVVLAS